MAAINSLSFILSRHTRIAIDSSVFIYAFEEHPKYAAVSAFVFDYAAKHSLTLLTSVITLSEILVQPVRKKNSEVVHMYERLLDTLPNFLLLDITQPIAKTAAYLRATYSIYLSDAYQIAAPVHNGATLFITNDKRLKKIKELSVVCFDDFV